jgi:hypothetical protein
VRVIVPVEGLNSLWARGTPTAHVKTLLDEAGSPAPNGRTYVKPRQPSTLSAGHRASNVRRRTVFGAPAPVRWRPPIGPCELMAVQQWSSSPVNSEVRR